MVLGQEAERGLRGAGRPTSVQPTGPKCHLRLGDVVRGALRVVAGMNEARQALGLIGLEHVDAERRHDPEHEHGADQRRPRQHGHVLPADAGEQKHGGGHCRVDERRPEVGLREDERGKRR